MLIDRKWWPLAAFVACVLSTGVPYWLQPYASVSLPTALLGPALLAVPLAAALLRGSGRCSIAVASGVAGMAVPMVVLLRVIVETAADPTSHNLWPFEIVLAAMLGFPLALIGAMLGAAFGRPLDARA